MFSCCKPNEDAKNLDVEQLIVTPRSQQLIKKSGGSSAGKTIMVKQHKEVIPGNNSRFVNSLAGSNLSKVSKNVE
jgi:hypothetical protein